MSVRETILKATFLPSGETIDHPEKFEFPPKQPLMKRLKDVLDAEVDEKYYLSDEQTKRLRESTFNQQKARENTPDSIAPTVCARDYKDPQCVRVGGLYDSKTSKHQAGSVYDPRGIAATLSTMQGGNQEPIIVASRGRNPANPSDRTPGAPTEQRLEPKFDGTTNTLTSVQKDNYVATPYRIRKLTPKECWRLMGFTDEDFEKAEKVNSNTQLYKQAGNSIVVNVLEAILKNLVGGTK